ncbi:MAG: JAB domain-containing protein [Rubrivivax sp.]
MSDVALENFLLGGARAIPLDPGLLAQDNIVCYAGAPAHRAAMVADLLQCAKELQRRRTLSALASATLDCPEAVREYLRSHFAGMESERLVVVFLTATLRVLAVEEMFKGTLAQMTVHPREVVKRALALNAAAVILAHNHPSGVAEPSRADAKLTETLKSVLSFIDVGILDHYVVAGDACVSMAERGLM